MTSLQIALAPVAALLLISWWWLRRNNAQRSAPRDAPSERVDTLIGWPPQPTRILTSRERTAFTTLVRAMPEHMVLAQVPLSRFLSVPKRNSYADWLRRVGYQCVDFAVCDSAAQVIAVIELQGEGGPPSERAKKRLSRIARSLKAANIPLLTWHADALPSVAAARAEVLPKPSPVVAAFATPVAATSPLTPPAAGFNPFDDAGRDSTQDEHIELLEPPPSTWFDDLDSQPMPLAKA